MDEELDEVNVKHGKFPEESTQALNTTFKPNVIQTRSKTRQDHESQQYMNEFKNRSNQEFNELEEFMSDS